MGFPVLIGILVRLPQRGAWPLNLGIVPRDQDLPKEARRSKRRASEDVSFFLNEVPGLSIWASCRATRRCLASQSGHRAARPGPSQSPLSSSDRHSSCYAPRASCRATRTFPKKPTIKASGVRRRFVLPQRGAWPLNLGIVPRDQEVPGLSIWASCRATRTFPKPAFQF